METAISVIVLILALSGNLLINFKKKIGYIVWIASNIAWIAVNIIGYTNISQIAMYAVYMVLNVHGYISWKKKEAQNGKCLRKLRKAHGQ